MGLYIYWKDVHLWSTRKIGRLLGKVTIVYDFSRHLYLTSGAAQTDWVWLGENFQLGKHSKDTREENKSDCFLFVRLTNTGVCVCSNKMTTRFIYTIRRRAREKKDELSPRKSRELAHRDRNTSRRLQGAKASFLFHLSFYGRLIFLSSGVIRPEEKWRWHAPARIIETSRQHRESSFC